MVEVECLGVERLRASIESGHGVLLAPNHCRECDPMVVAELSGQARRDLFVMASAHLFMAGRFMAWFLRRAGAFSVYREGLDRAAVSAAVDILEQARRPLVIFAEGVVSRTNDHLNALMEGTALIARSAAKRRAKTRPPGKVVAHAVAIRYKLLDDVEEVLPPKLEDVERRLTWRPQSGLPLVERITKAGLGLLALKEIEYLGAPQTGLIQERLARLLDHILAPLEEEWCKGQREPNTIARIKRLRAAILPDLVKGDIPEEERQRRWRQLEDVYLAQQIDHYPPDYVDYAGPEPTAERLLETVERFEEDLTDKVRVYGRLKAVVEVGEAIEVSPEREGKGADALMLRIEESLRSMLGISKAR